MGKGYGCGLPVPAYSCERSSMSEIIFEVHEDEVDGGFVATALGHAIATQGESVEELREMVRDAVRCHFGDGAAGEMPQIIRLHFVRDEALAV
jgi:predicted RNase H-like HicB family nuclease